MLDLHGAHPGHEFGLTLGTIDGRTCPAYEATSIDHLLGQEFSPGAASLPSPPHSVATDPVRLWHMIKALTNLILAVG